MATQAKLTVAVQEYVGRGGAGSLLRVLCVFFAHDSLLLASFVVPVCILFFRTPALATVGWMRAHVLFAPPRLPQALQCVVGDTVGVSVRRWGIGRHCWPFNSIPTLCRLTASCCIWRRSK